MDITLAKPQQRATAPILAISILLGILLFPAFERALMKWMPICIAVRAGAAFYWKFCLGPKSDVVLRPADER